MIEIYTDGSAIGKTPDYYGGWASIVVENEVPVKVMSGNGFPMTNNEAELRGIKAAIEYALASPEKDFIILSDSAYSLNAIQDWIYKWSVNGWKNSKKETVANVELFKEIYELIKFTPSNIYYKKVKGHSGNLYNEMADDYAVEESAKAKELYRKEHN